MSPEKRRKIIKILFWRIPIILMVVGAVLIGALKIVERYPEPLRQGFEEYLSAATARNATIGTLENVKLFPNFIIHAENITFHNAHNAAVIDLDVEEFKMNSPFSSVFFNSKKINYFTIKNLTAKEGMFGKKSVKITTAEIITKQGPDQFGSFFAAHGKYGEDDAVFEMELGVNKYNYFISRIIPFSIKIANYNVSANLKRNLLNLTSQNTIFSSGERHSESKDYVLTDKQVLLTGNPISCVLREEDLKQCEKYLTEE